MHELQSLLLQKLPRLGELTFGCEVKRKKDGELLKVVKWGSSLYNFISCLNSQYVDVSVREDDIEIIGHKPSHADILEALGEDWAMTGGYKLLWFDKEINEWRNDTAIHLPSNISDLSLPEYEETRKQLIQLLTK